MQRSQQAGYHIFKIYEGGCRGVAFLLAEVSTIEAEMDLWTRECLRYFPVKKARSYAEAVQKWKA